MDGPPTDAGDLGEYVDDLLVGQVAEGCLAEPSVDVGYVVVALLIAAWIGALAVWRYGNIGQRWPAHLATADPTMQPSSAL